jgi:hypothetical protein
MSANSSGGSRARSMGRQDCAVASKHCIWSVFTGLGGVKHSSIAHVRRLCVVPHYWTARRPCCVGSHLGEPLGSPCTIDGHMLSARILTRSLRLPSVLALLVRLWMPRQVSGVLGGRGSERASDLALFRIRNIPRRAEARHLFWAASMADFEPAAHCQRKSRMERVVQHARIKKIDFCYLSAQRSSLELSDEKEMACQNLFTCARRTFMFACG